MEKPERNNENEQTYDAAVMQNCHVTQVCTWRSGTKLLGRLNES